VTGFFEETRENILQIFRALEDSFLKARYSLVALIVLLTFFQGNDIRLLHFLEEDESLENEYESTSSDTG
jgi:hypothetical protein